MKGSVAEKVVLKEGGFLVRSTFTRMCEGKCCRKSGLKRGWVLGEEYIHKDV